MPMEGRPRSSATACRAFFPHASGMLGRSGLIQVTFKVGNRHELEDAYPVT